MRCSKKTETFADVIAVASNYFGLSPEDVFMADKPVKGCIYLNEQKVFDEIFPFRTAKKVGFLPTLHIVLKRNKSSIDLVNNEKSLFDEKRKEEEELQKEEEAKNKAEYEKELERMAQAEHEQVMETYRSRRWWRDFLWGGLSFAIVLVLFLMLFASSWTFQRNGESYQMREAVIGQFLGRCTHSYDGWEPPEPATCDAFPMANVTDVFAAAPAAPPGAPAPEAEGEAEAGSSPQQMTCDPVNRRRVLPDRAAAARIMLDFEERLNDKGNHFFEHNKMLPWVQVAAYRKKLTDDCWKPEGHEHHVECRESIHSGTFDESDFDGAPYHETGGAPVRLRLFTFDPAGNRKSVQVARLGEDGSDYTIVYREALMKEVFCRGWLNDDVLIFTIDYNFFNVGTGILMSAQMVLTATDQGMLSLEMDTKRFTTPIGQDDTAGTVIIWLSVVLNLANIVKTFRNIKSNRYRERMLAAYAEQEGQEEKGEKEAAAEDEDQEEEDFDLTDVEYTNVMRAEEGGGKMFRRLKFASKYAVRCHCFRGANGANVLTLTFSFLMVVGTLVKEAVKSGVEAKFLGEDMTQDFIDFGPELNAQLWVALLDFVLYMLAIVVLGNFFLQWLPDVFSRLTLFVGYYVNRQVALIYLGSFLLLGVIAGTRLTIDGAYLYRVHDLGYAAVRSLLVLNGGYYAESNISIVGDVVESNAELEAYVSPHVATFQHALISFLYRFFTFNILIALMVYYLADARARAGQIQRVLRDKENKQIEAEIRKDRKKADEAAKKVKF